MQQDPKPVNETPRKRYKSAFRNRRRANRLSASDLREVQATFEIIRNSEDVGTKCQLPRPEVIDGVLIGLGSQIRFALDQINWVRKQMGIATTSVQGPFLLEPGDKPAVRTFVQPARKTA